MADLSNEEVILTKAEMLKEIADIEKAFAESTAGYAEKPNVRLGVVQHDREVMIETAKRIVSDDSTPSYMSQMFQMHMRYMRESITTADTNVAEGHLTSDDA